jgi:hypothetical protein
VDAFKEKQAMRQLEDDGAGPPDSTVLSETSPADAVPPAGWRRQFRCHVLQLTTVLTLVDDFTPVLDGACIALCSV